MPDTQDTSPTSLYLYYDEYETLIYVGVTSRGTARQREHNADKVWWPLVQRQTVEHFGTRAEALAAEKATIVANRPPFNVQHNGDAATHLANYEAFRRRVTTGISVVAQADSLNRRIGVFMTNLDGNVAELMTDPRFPDIAEAMNRQWQCPIHRPTGGVCGHTQSVRRVGPSLIITAIVRKDVTEMMNGFLRFTTPPKPRRQARVLEPKVILLGGHS